MLHHYPQIDLNRFNFIDQYTLSLDDEDNEN